MESGTVTFVDEDGNEKLCATALATYMTISTE